MGQDFLSDVELFCTSHSIIDDVILIDGEEAHHITHVMRHYKGDAIHITDGNGSIYKSVISEVGKRNVLAKAIEIYFQVHPLFYIKADVSPQLILFSLTFSFVGSILINLGEPIAG